ncbi:HAD family hydrolase [Companilactobacillus keshanensis]|uniref:HAD family hydrolase n=1 Tax=Companilactobacillus keshanensis TaxID=2486003 RepID=A0ABW4BSB0_9LACO|nr:HAD family hydrolase [Companilactobacillus keshanensis]
MPKYLTFDCYGTLMNEDNTYDEVERLAKIIGVDPKKARARFIKYQDDPSNVHPYQDYDLLTRSNLINLDFQFDLDHQFEKYYVEVLMAHRELKPFPEVNETLHKLTDMGYKLIMMSNSSWDIIPYNADQLDAEFDIWTAEDVHVYKPDIKFFKRIQEHYGFTNENHIHIAQGYDTDIVTTNKLGWNSIWVNREYMKPTQAARPTHEIHTLDKVIDILS